MGSAFIVVRARYTEIDWKAYMQEVQAVIDGEYDYLELRGGTGPLVYPAGFVWIFVGLHRLHHADPQCCRLPPTDVTESDRCVSGGGDLRLAQWLFLLLYLGTQAVVMAAYRRAQGTPPWALMLLCLSLRVHSLYLLRMFNDCVAMAFAYLMLLLFAVDRPTAASIAFSAAVSVKMNALLFAPAVALLLLRARGWFGAIECAGYFVGMQLALAMPFLHANPAGYFAKAFELSRGFEQRWSVNWQFVPPDTFNGRPFAVALLLLHLLLLVAFAHRRWCAVDGGLPALLLGCGRRGADGGRRPTNTPGLVLDTMLTCNFIGIAAARTLHYQFYSWYFHALPFLLWRTELPTVVRLALLGGVELAFNVYPASAGSSLVLQGCHIVILVALWLAPVDSGTGRLNSKEA